MQKVNRPPDDWQRPQKKNVNDTDFEDLDNPGQWCEFVYKPKYKKISGGHFKYLHHALPTGCTVAPKDIDGRYKVGEWEMFYDDWKSSLND